MLNTDLPRILAMGFLMARLWMPQARGAAVDAAGICDEIRRIPGYEAKVVRARQFALAGTGPVRDAFLTLVTNGGWWDREAALEGLACDPDGAVDAILVRQLCRDHMVGDTAKRLLLARAKASPKVLLDLFADGVVEGTPCRLPLVPVLAALRHTDGDLALQREATSTNRATRRPCLEALAEASPNAHDPFIRGFLKDPELREVAFAHVLRHGGPRDLPLFLGILQDPGARSLLPFTYQAVGKWSPLSNQIVVFSNGLKDPDEGLVRLVLVQMSPAVARSLMPALKHLAMQGRDQTTRFGAISLLLPVKDRSMVPLFVHMLGETYDPPRRSAWDALPALMTIGLSTLVQGMGDQWKEREFKGNLAAIARALTEITGQPIPAEYKPWLTWALGEGYVVDGRNLIQELFSPMAEVRSRAAQNGARILGRPPSAANPSEEDLLQLARELMAKGYLVGPP